MALQYDDEAFATIPRSEQGRLVLKTEWLWANRHTVTHILLREDLNPLLKWRVGDYRIIYSYDAATDEMIIHLVAHRKEVYKIAADIDH